VLLLRHASAGERLSSRDIDRFRQLDHAGRSDARQLVGTLVDQVIERVVTSPLARCVETVIPIAENRRLVIERRDELLPDASLESVLALLGELPGASLLCTHREVFRTLFGADVTCEKGAAWLIERDGSFWSPTAYIPSPASVPDRFARTLSRR
jgi:8-oxo-dGTP diphosphatase